MKTGPTPPLSWSDQGWGLLDARGCRSCSKWMGDSSSLSWAFGHTYLHVPWAGGSKPVGLGKSWDKRSTKEIHMYTVNSIHDFLEEHFWDNNWQTSIDCMWKANLIRLVLVNLSKHHTRERVKEGKTDNKDEKPYMRFCFLCFWPWIFVS